MRPSALVHSLALLLLAPLCAAQTATTTSSTSSTASTSPLPAPSPTAPFNTSYPTASGPYSNLTASSVPVLLVFNTTTTSPTTSTASTAPAAASVSVVFSTEMATAAAAPTTVTSIVVAPLGGVTGMQTLVTLPGATGTGPVGGVQTAGVGRKWVGRWRVGVGVGAGVWMLG
ncbi:hypothetical protein MMC27_004042 [Xylographa pallens]|nr:hypothetical protein [Xylographa pallens]